MKETELRKAAKCANCHKLFGHTGIPLFWRVTIERHGVDLDAIRRQDGLTAVLGGHTAIAQAMGLNEEMTTPMMEPVTITLCEHCSLDNVIVASLAEDHSDKG